ncbi:MAG: hypothetical protein PF442_09695 [Desulfobulbaceae bacterium]|jgi:hypothetical protein|nr:hypothetical protein [Desulfobulbaceae bacterium]
MKFLQVFPFIISSLLLGAHFYRAGILPLVFISLLLPLLLLIRTNAALRLAQACLVLGSLEWLRTIYVLAIERQQLGQSWTRLAIILGGVALFTALSSLPLSRVMKEIKDTGQR